MVSAYRLYESPHDVCDSLRIWLLQSSLPQVFYIFSMYCEVTRYIQGGNTRGNCFKAPLVVKNTTEFV